MSEITVELYDHSPVVSRQVKDSLRNRTRQALKLLKEEIKRATPVRTGRLQSGWEDKIEDDLNELLGAVYNEVPYGIYVDGRRPFVGPAIERVKDQLRQLFVRVGVNKV